MESVEQKYSDDQIDISGVLSLIWKKRLFITSLTLTSTIASLIISLMLSNIYTSSALLAPVNDKDSLSSSLGALSGLSAIAGVNLPGESNTPTQEAIARIKSLHFFSENIIPNIQLENLMALKSWDQKTDTLIYREDHYDPISKKWIRNVKFPKSTIPSNQEAYERFMKNFSISEDAKTGFISISISHKSPKIAQKWLQIIIENIRNTMRSIDKEEAINSIEFLNEQYNKTTNTSLKDSISKLLETQMQNLMLTSASKNYILKIIDEPAIPEEKSSPARPLIIFLGFILGLFFSILFIFSKNLLKN